MRTLLAAIFALAASAALADQIVVTTHVGAHTGRVTTYTRIYDDAGNKLSTTISSGGRVLVFDFQNKRKSETVNGKTRTWRYNPATIPCQSGC